MRSRQQSSQRPVARKSHPLVLRPAYFAVETARSFTLFWFRIFLNLVSYTIGVVAFATGKDPKDITNLSFLHSPKSERKEAETKSFGERVKGVASKALPSSYELDSLREQLHQSKTMIARLEADNAEQRLQQAALASNMIVNEIAHEIQPDLRDEFEVEQKLLRLLQSRMQDTREAEEYRQAAETQAVYYNGVVESLRADLMKELEVIEHQQEDKETLEKKVNVAKSLIDTLKEKLVAEEERRNQDLEEQKKKFKAQQERVTSEFKTATDFCKDLRRKLEAETKHKDLLLQTNEKLQSESEEYHERVEELSEKLRESNIALQEQRNQFAQLKKEREMEITKFQNELKEVNNKLTINKEKTVVLQKKSEEGLKKQTEKAEQELKEFRRKYEAEIKEAQRNLEAELEKHEREHKVSRELIATLQHKDTEDVQKEQAKARAEIKKIEGEHRNLVDKLNAKISRMEDEVATTAAMLNLLKGEYETEKVQAKTLSTQVSQFEQRVELLQSDVVKAENNAAQLKKELEHERAHVQSKIDAEKKKFESSQAELKRELNVSHKREINRLQEELDSQKNLIKQTEARLESTKSELVGRITETEAEKKETLIKLRETEKNLKNREVALQEITRLQESASKRADSISHALEEEKRRADLIKNKLEAQLNEALEKQQKREDHFAQLDREVTIAKTLIDTLRSQLSSESAKNAELAKQWNAEKAAQEKEVRRLEELIAKEKRAANSEHEKVTQMKVQTQGLEARNSVLQKDVQATSEKATNSTTINEQVKIIEKV